MFDLQQAESALWEFSILLRFLVLCLLIFRDNVRSVPLFSLYLSANFAQSLVLALTYKTWGEPSKIGFAVAWGTEALVVCTRAVAVAELCRLMLGGYRGIWSLARRVLLSCAILVLAYSALVSQHTWSAAIFGANRALELTIATVIVTLFVFLRLYQVVAEPALRALALGFCLYACVAVLNSTVLEQLLDRYYPVWNLSGIVAFLGCLLVWAFALRKSIPRLALNLVLLPGSVYGHLSPEINMRLYLLNERLAQFWKRERP